jgi:hypothetical protein
MNDVAADVVEQVDRLTNSERIQPVEDRAMHIGALVVSDKSTGEAITVSGLTKVGEEPANVRARLLVGSMLVMKFGNGFGGGEKKEDLQSSPPASRTWPPRS